MSDWNLKVIEVLRANGGTAPSMGGMPLLILRATGARSGQPRETPILYRERGDDLVVFASYAGAPTHPAWYYNLVAHPEVTVEVGGERRAVRARVAGRAERDELYDWNKQDFEWFAEYEEKTDRTIPVVVLEPVA
jgi:deazaflavin-dependent oxidoreductase (nitroreductase family)